MRLAEDVKEIGLIESPPLLDGRNMVMVLGPTKNAGVKKRMPKQKTHSGAKKRFKVTGAGSSCAGTAIEEPPPREQVAEAEAELRQGPAGRQERRSKVIKQLLGRR